MAINKCFPVLAVLVTISCLASPPGYLGVALTDIPPAAHIPGTMIGQVAPDSPASRSGLRPGDLIRSIDKHSVSSAQGAQSYILSHNAGDVLVFELLRQGPRGYVASRVEVRLGPPPNAPVPEKDSSGKPPARESPKSSWSSERNIRYRRYVDPAEQAFADMVPEGWRVGGRRSALRASDDCAFLAGGEPGRGDLVQLGDWHIQDYSDIPGWRAGTVYTPGTSVMSVRRLESAKQYARSYGLNFGKWLGCEESQFADSEVAQTPWPCNRAEQPGRNELSPFHVRAKRPKICRAGDDDRAVLSTTDGNNRLECVVPGERAYAARSGRHRYRGVGQDAGHDPIPA